MAAFLSSLSKSIQCKADELGVHDPSRKDAIGINYDDTRNSLHSGCSGCSTYRRRRHHDKKNKEKKQTPVVCSPKSLRSNEVENFAEYTNYGDDLLPTQVINNMKGWFSKKIHGSADSLLSDGYEHALGTSNIVCRDCGERLKSLAAFEAHHISKHAVTELTEGGSSRKIVEMICKSSMVDSHNKNMEIQRVLKVKNNRKTLERFEEHRETVKTKATKLSTKHSRAAADGNELLRFYGTTIACSLGTNGSSGLCELHNCNVCQLLRHGFSKKQQPNDISVGVLTTATSATAYESIALNEDDRPSLERALIVCRVVAGRVHKALENRRIEDIESQTDGFDSLAVKVSQLRDFEELYVLNANALLPCFVIVCAH